MGNDGPRRQQQADSPRLASLEPDGPVVRAFLGNLGRRRPTLGARVRRHGHVGPAVSLVGTRPSRGFISGGDGGDRLADRSSFGQQNGTTAGRHARETRRLAGPDLPMRQFIQGGDAGSRILRAYYVGRARITEGPARKTRRWGRIAPWGVEAEKERLIFVVTESGRQRKKKITRRRPEVTSMLFRAPSAHRRPEECAQCGESGALCPAPMHIPGFSGPPLMCNARPRG